MFRRICGVLAVSLLALVLVGAGASAGANRHTITLTMSTEAWYQEPPPCVSLIDCSAAPAASPYPQDTVHVSVTGGQETARTYLAFRFLVPFGASLLGGTLSLPVDQDPGAGTLQPDQADMQACLVTGSFKAVRGSLATPPKADCRRTWGAQYDSKTATFTVDLTPFLSAWRSGSAALALLPTKQALQGGETWHAAFFATTKPSKASPPITATLSYTAPPHQASSSTSYPITGGTSAG